MTDRVLTTIDGAVAHVRLNRPDKRNGLDLAMAKGIIAAGEALKGNNAVRAVVLSGEGKAFCAGLDFKAFLSGGAEVLGWFLGERVGPANNAQRCGWVWQELQVPVIAAVHGVAYGGGLQIALGADIRLVTPDARMSVMEIDYGMIPDMGISRGLLRQVRPDVAKELLFTGRRVDGVEAAAIGLATRVCEDPLAEALALAQQIAARNPHAVRRNKQLVNEALEVHIDQAFELETTLQKQLLGTPNQLEAMTARMTRRTPTFKDPIG